MNIHNYPEEIKPFKLQQKEIRILYKNKGLLPHEYYEFNMQWRYDSCILSGYVGAYLSRIIWATHYCRDFMIFDDKLSTSHLLDDWNIPQPINMRGAVYDTYVLKKPRFGHGGQGIEKIANSDLTKYIYPSSRRPIPDSEKDYILQRIELPHPDLCLFMNENNLFAFPSLRLTVMNGAIVHSLLRVSRDPDSVVDNYNRGGAVAPVYIKGDDIFLGSFYSHHNQNNSSSQYVPMRGSLDYLLTADGFSSMVTSLINSLNQLAHGPYMVGVDILLTNDGPKVVEINRQPGLRMVQIAEQRGFLDVFNASAEKQMVYFREYGISSHILESAFEELRHA